MPNIISNIPLYFTAIITKLAVKKSVDPPPPPPPNTYTILPMAFSPFHSIVHFHPPPMHFSFRASASLKMTNILLHLLCFCYCFSHLIGLHSVTWIYIFTLFFLYLLFLSDERPTLEALEYTIRIGNSPTFLYFVSLLSLLLEAEKNGSKSCELCLTETYHTIFHKLNLLNKRNEILISRHPNKHLSCNFKAMPPDNWNFLFTKYIYSVTRHSPLVVWRLRWAWNTV